MPEIKMLGAAERMEYAKDAFHEDSIRGWIKHINNLHPLLAVLEYSRTYAFLPLDVQDFVAKVLREEALAMISQIKAKAEIVPDESLYRLSKAVAEVLKARSDSALLMLRRLRSEYLDYADLEQSLVTPMARAAFAAKLGYPDLLAAWRDNPFYLANADLTEVVPVKN